MSNRYFYINDLHLVGKTVNDSAYLYRNKSWEDDQEFIIQNRLSGYCPITNTLGNPHMMIKIDEITKEEAERLMHLF